MFALSTAVGPKLYAAPVFPFGDGDCPKIELYKYNQSQVIRVKEKVPVEYNESDIRMEGIWVIVSSNCPLDLANISCFFDSILSGPLISCPNHTT